MAILQCFKVCYEHSLPSRNSCIRHTYFRRLQKNSHPQKNCHPQKNSHLQKNNHPQKSNRPQKDIRLQRNLRSRSHSHRSYAASTCFSAPEPPQPRQPHLR